MKKTPPTSISIINSQKEVRIPVVRLAGCLARLSLLEHLPHAEINVVFLDAPNMSRLNWQFLRHRGPTDVITFQHGEIIVCPTIAAREATKRGVPVFHEMLLYAIHGWLHLRGHDDHCAKDAEVMATAQEALLKKLLKKQVAEQKSMSAK